MLGFTQFVRRSVLGTSVLIAGWGALPLAAQSGTAGFSGVANTVGAVPTAEFGGPALESSSTNLLTNGSFESFDFTGWSHTGDTGFTGFVRGGFFGEPTDGEVQAYFSPWGIGTISQTVATVVGMRYTLSFDLSNPGLGLNYWAVLWNGNILESMDSSGPFLYSTRTFVVEATGASSSLSFDFMHRQKHFLLDNVRLVAAVPEPQSWALMIAAFGWIGAATRRRRRVVA
jgi:hypothetical protein